jgi:hypothetical protein
VLIVLKTINYLEISQMKKVFAVCSLALVALSLTACSSYKTNALDENVPRTDAYQPAPCFKAKDGTCADMRK